MGCASSVDTREDEERGASKFTRKKKNSMVENIKKGQWADDERQGFRSKAKKKNKRFSVVDFVRDALRRDDKVYAGLEPKLVVTEVQNGKPVESSASNVRGKRQAESSSSETTARCTLCGDKPEKKLTCVLCGKAQHHHTRGRRRSVSLDDDAFTRALKGSKMIPEDFEFDDQVPQTSSPPIRYRAPRRRSVSADGIAFTAAIGKLSSTAAPFCTRPQTRSHTCPQHRPSYLWNVANSVPARG
jgi:hypothetical protein